MKARVFGTQTINGTTRKTRTGRLVDMTLNIEKNTLSPRQQFAATTTAENMQIRPKYWSRTWQ